MEVLNKTFKDRRKFENFIQGISGTLQRSQTKDSNISEHETEISDNEHRRSRDPSYHYIGYSCPFLYNQYRQTSKVSNFFRSAEGMAVSAFRSIGKVDINFRVKTREPANSNKCDVDIRAQEKTQNQNDLVQSINNRKQGCQKTNSKLPTANRFIESSSLSLGCEWEFGNESRVLAVQELCRNEYIISSSITVTQATDQNSCNGNSDTKNESTLLELQNDHETQHTQDLLELLKNKEPYHDEIDKKALNDIEIALFAGMYGITDFCLVLARNDSVFWLKDHNGVIYFWSRIDDSMIRGGDNLEEALTNYLFHHENLYYVDEVTRKLVPINAYDKKAEEFAKSPESYVYIDAKYSTKQKWESGRKKKQKNKKNKKKY
ncbi:uncharacterized protein OCT59_001861 [Rhizophagus irregularis]|uniref:Uncharacterized protein n=3 Tax=Rhizophagus irregularis TaxID=588596 RepID=A0A2H5TER1_RHIID|nr:hypothetical protein GLOIN_2v1808555 [Rhizophagus irregularis DAOM 181602=DAOM 197198]POG63549.1 hypothetical protein GLOIN_2v1808555 [Rhizophagus irregularis DAOM 181602=DAOM 197198]UZO10266.1 hypothetical protein OCT59_001861 [Rhizophagus irregularis]GBC41059.1 hypothetical protein GLOIN_2v1808555 [Rhizophagus irregularis DAOM 181602=DAOM 197198]|eukprot:XP_025170415.1 hypothetical protein GLOIN_2v1808555 [Rhizophagus irregularis DAOM 181602=DAOM 197198]